jgi:hypothetical protein
MESVSPKFLPFIIGEYTYFEDQKTMHCVIAQPRIFLVSKNQKVPFIFK